MQQHVAITHSTTFQINAAELRKIFGLDAEWKLKHASAGIARDGSGEGAIGIRFERDSDA